MNKKVSVLAAVVFGATAPVWAGLIDHGDHTGFPNVNVDAHLVRIGKFYFPEASEKLPKGMSRPEAWRHDIAEAAKGLNIPADKLEKFTDHVIRHYRTSPVAAPHEKLLEFELYARGRNELFFHKSVDELPPAWQRLFALPVEIRRYTTIPVLYVWNNFCLSRNARWNFNGDAAETIAAARRSGCVDTQGCELALLCEEPPLIYQRRNFRVKLIEYQWLFRAYAVKCVPNKPWRYINVYDRFLHAESRGDAFYSGGAMPDLRYSLYREREETLRELCRRSPALRDLIVAVGLTNYQMEVVRKVAFEFARESELNYPILALRVPLAEAEKLLKDRPEHARLLDLLKLKALSGMAKVKAIDAYIAKYPDYTPEDMPVTSVALNTHGELQALAGLELFKLGRPREALERWMICGTPEDIGIVAEQVFTVDELIAFCRQYDDRRIRDADLQVHSSQCAKYDNPVQAPIFSFSDGAVHILRNILARRLMRAGRFEEAQKWFTGMRERYAMGRFMELRAVLLDPKAARADKLAASLSLAALVRFRGDLLFGTFLEPDNVICHGRFACEWGRRVTHIKLDKPKLPRFHYRWIAAEFYRRAAEYTDDPELKGFCFWMAGTLLKNRDPKLAEADFKKLFAIRPELTENNWFKPLSKCGKEVKELYVRRFFTGSPRVTAAILKLPEVKKVGLPPHDGSAKALFDTGVRLVSLGSRKGGEAIYYERLYAAWYAYFLAGEKGMAGGYYQCGLLCREMHEDEIFDVAFFNKALETDPKFAAAKLMLGEAYLRAGHWDRGMALLREVADGADRDLAEIASFVLAEIYLEGRYGVTSDEEAAKRYLKRAGSQGCEVADARELECRKKRLAERIEKSADKQDTK